MLDNKLIFSVSRSDLLYNYASKFEDIFRFQVDASDDFSPQQGVRLQEALGFDFQTETDPVIQIAPMVEIFNSHVRGENPNNFSVFITIEDIALGIRKTIFSRNINEIQELTNFKINLGNDPSFGFYRGYTVRCFISREVDVAQKSSLMWSKSNIVYHAEFISKSSVDEALFEIAWTTFKDNEDRKNLLYYVDWASDDVTSSSHGECFQVKANYDLKAQFKRLENNAAFGHFSIYLIAERIVSELAEKTLACADLTLDPLEDSLHAKIDNLFDTLKLDFESDAQSYQDGGQFERLMVTSKLHRAIQSSHKLAQSLSKIKFGGFRA